MSRAPAGAPVVPSSVEVLEPFVEAGLFEAPEIQLAATLARLEPDVSDEVLLALALAARGPRLGHVCVEPAAAGRAAVDPSEGDVAGLPWPDPDHWSATLARSELVANPSESGQLPLRPLVWDGTRLYLHRYWHHESTVAERLLALAAAGSAGPPSTGLTAAVDLAFPREDSGSNPPIAEAGSGAPRTAAVPGSDRGSSSSPEVAGSPVPLDGQRLAVERALTNRVSVIAGGPGTGKTRTIAALLEAAHRLARWDGASLHVALAAPTGKAAARLAEAVGAAVQAGESEGRLPAELAEAILADRPTTLHRLLGPVPGARFRHDRHRPLPHDLIVVDEASMVSLPLMSGLLAAARPDARLVLVGDPHQLASVEVGNVLRDVVGPLGGATALAMPGTGRSPAGRGTVATGGWDTDAPEGVGPLAGRVTILRRVHRFSTDSAIAALAEAIRTGDAGRTVELLARQTAETTWVRGDDPVADAALAEEVIDAAVQVFAAARAGDAATGLRAALSVKVLSATRFGMRQWSERIERGVAGRDAGFEPHHRWYIGRPVMVTANDHLNQLANGDAGLVVHLGGRTRVALETGGSVRLVEPSRLGQVDTCWAMTIHKSQGSEFDHAVIALPGGPSPVLSRELLYTAVTRARRRVTVVGSEACVREAVTRPVARASGLASRLWSPAPPNGQRSAAPHRAGTSDAAGIHQDGHTPPLPSRT